MILSTHILSEVQATCDRVLIIHQGALVADGPTDAVMSGSGSHTLVVGIGAGKVKAGEEVLRSELAALDGVGRVDPIAPVDEAHRFKLEAARDVREDVFRWAVSGGHTLLELSSEKSNLEEVFRRLTIEAQGAAA